MNRSEPRYDKLFNDGIFNATLFIGPDPWDARFDFSVFREARLRLKKLGLELTKHIIGLEEFETAFKYNDHDVNARIRLVHGRIFTGDVLAHWCEAVAYEDLIYLKSHAGYGRHLSLSKDVSFFTHAMKEGFDHPDKKQYQLYYIDCCKSEMYYKDVFRDYVGSVDLILHKWFCDYKIIGPVIVLLQELMAGSDFETIMKEMNNEYGVPHFDEEDDPEDLKLDRKMITYSASPRNIMEPSESEDALPSKLAGHCRSKGTV